MDDLRETVEYSEPEPESKLIRRDAGSKAYSTTAGRVGSYELVRPIGLGGMSLVFEAIDTRSGQTVALKMLHTQGPSATQRLKREFRALADIHHVNVVQLHELIVGGEQPFFTMELIQGTSILEYLRVDGAPVHTRLVPTLRQLVDAVSSLHVGGILHRDLKPSNILVQPDGRVVVLDLGLARAVAEQPVGVGSGTPSYMAPERILGGVSSEPSDWYSVGVIIYEALTGRLPGALPTPRLTSTAATLELEQLCLSLLARDPSSRPDGSTLRSLFDLPPVPQASSLVRSPATDGLFVGRDAEDDWLRQAYEQAEGGRTVVAHVHGEPGVGKTALAKHFIYSLQEQHEVLVLESRCYEHELIPYNATDGLIDSVARHVAGLRRRKMPVALPDGAAELGKVFPVLATALGLPISTEALRSNADEPQRLRQRAFTAFRALLYELSLRQTIVIHLDDLQWGDADSAQLLSQLVQDRAHTRMLAIASYRRADAEHSVCVRALRALPVPPGDRRWDLCLESLRETTALELARGLLGTRLRDEQLRDLARESAGSPLFLRALARHYAVRSASGPTTLQSLLCTALERLPAATLKLLELVALAARPVRRELLLRAAQTEASDAVGADRLIVLQRSGLLRAVVETPDVALDTYHDRVREIVSASMNAATKQRYHAQLAAAEALSPEPDAEFLAYLYERADQHDSAALYAELAGDRASAAVALDRAADMYELALKCLHGKRPLDLLEKLANASAYAGRCAQAAPLYQELAHAFDADEARARRLLLRATEMFLRRGKVLESVSTVRPVLSKLGIRYPTFAPLALFSILSNMIQLRLRGAEHTPRSQPKNELESLQYELCFVLGYRLTLVDPLPGSALMLRGMVLALRSGSDSELARALACYAWILATLGWTSNEEQDRLLERAGDVARNLDDPDAVAWTLYFHGMTLYTRGHFDSAEVLLEQAHTWVAERCTDSGWLLAEIELFICAQHVAKGEVAKLRKASEPILRRLRDSGNEFQSAALGALRAQITVARDEPQVALRELDEILAVWTAYAPAIITVWSKVNTLMYQGQPMAAWQTMQHHWPAFGRAGYRRVNPWRVALPLLESTVALACAHQGLGHKYLNHVRAGIRWLKRQKADWAQPSWMLLQAGLSHIQGEREAAAQLYRAAAERYEQLAMLGYASIARMRQSALMDGPEVAHLRARAEQWFADEGIQQPASWMKMYAPVD